MAEMEHVRIGQDDMPHVSDGRSGIGRSVAVEGVGRNILMKGLDQLIEPRILVLRQGLGWKEVKSPSIGIGHDASGERGRLYASVLPEAVGVTSTHMSTRVSVVHGLSLVCIQLGKAHVGHGLGQVRVQPLGQRHKRGTATDHCRVGHLRGSVRGTLPRANQRLNVHLGRLHTEQMFQYGTAHFLVSTRHSRPLTDHYCPLLYARPKNRSEPELRVTAVR